MREMNCDRELHILLLTDTYAQTQQNVHKAKGYEIIRCTMKNLLYVF